MTNLQGKLVFEKEYIPLIKSAFRKNFSDKEIGQEFSFKPVSDEEWAIIGNEDMNVYDEYMEKLMKMNMKKSSMTL